MYREFTTHSSFSSDLLCLLRLHIQTTRAYTFTRYSKIRAQYTSTLAAEVAVARGHALDEDRELNCVWMLLSDSDAMVSKNSCS